MQRYPQSSDRAWQSVLGGNRLGLSPGGALPAEKGHRHSWQGRHLKITVSHEVSQVRVEKFKGEQFYNLKETGNT